MAAGKTETAGSLVARFSHQLMNDQQWPRLEHCLHLLPREQIKQDPALLVLEAWLHHVRQNTSGVKACLERIKTLNDTSPPNTLVNVEHVQGHFEVLLGIQHYMDSDGYKALASLQCAREALPLRQRRARLFADIFQLGAYQMVGDLETGLQIYHEAMRDGTSPEVVYNSAYLINLCHVYWMDADLKLLRHTAVSALQVDKEKQLPETIANAFYFLGIVHYHRNEMQKAEEKLATVVNEHHVISPMTFARSSFALSLTFQALEDPYKARETANAVVTDAIETNSKDRLQAARAFEAELALRQGRLAVASRWAKEFQAKLFRPNYGFYLPQITLIRTLFDQGGADNLQQAADLLDQLNDFLLSIHNKIFQIPVLALQALQFDSQGEKSVAIEKLTEALNLAEPGGFIRLFVDLGPQMADLLKRFVRQNVAVGYIGQILAAFSDQEHRTALDPTDHTSPPSDHPMPKVPPHAISQPLAELLTNRELEISNLLVQRLSNKEIAARLFISPETVKKHLNNIYRKLNVSSRQQEVEKAQALGIPTR